nr:MAG: replication initiator protein [Microvirus sp.]
MCKAPQTLADGTIVGCRNCLQCLGRAVDDWTGRCIAESKFSTAPFFIDLTYGRELNDAGEQVGSSDHERAALLTYSDVQKYFKRLRKNGFPARYFAVGEYGGEKGRAHWHLLVFWQGEVPEHDPSTRENPVRFMERHWPHGWSRWEPLGVNPEDTSAAVRYVCKYLRKDFGGKKPERQAKCEMSKIPLLGAEYLDHRAGLFVRQGLAPQGLFYSFPDLRERDGRPKKFMLRPGSAAADYFCQSYLDQWAKAHQGECKALRFLREPNRAERKFFGPHTQIYAVWGERCTPPSALIDEYSDKLAKPLLEADKWQSVLEEKEKELAAKRAGPPVSSKRWDHAYGWGFNLHRPDDPPPPGQRSAVPLD